MDCLKVRLAIFHARQRHNWASHEPEQRSLRLRIKAVQEWQMFETLRLIFKNNYLLIAVQYDIYTLIFIPPYVYDVWQMASRSSAIRRIHITCLVCHLPVYMLGTYVCLKLQLHTFPCESQPRAVLGSRARM